MDKPFGFAWNLYTKQFEKFLILMLCTTLPMLLLHSFITNFIYLVTPPEGTLFGVADIYYGLITIIFFLYAQFPYIRFVYNEYEGHDHSLRNALFQFIVNGFTVFVFACIVGLLSTIGFMLFALPGMIFLSLVFPIAYISIFEEKSIWKAYREGIRIGKKNFFKIMLLLFIGGILEMVIGLVITYSLINVTQSYAAQVITQIVLNLIFFPFLISVLTAWMIKWKDAQRSLDIEVSEATQ